jgi:hypothetical protein
MVFRHLACNTAHPVSARQAPNLAVFILVCACGGNSPNQADALQMDAPVPDAPDVPNSLEGEYVDWDSTNAHRCGISGALLTVNGQFNTATSANGQFGLAMDSTATEVDITPPTTDATCALGSGSGSGDQYIMPGRIIVDPILVQSGIQYSLRAFTAQRRASFFASQGLTFDPTKAQVFVNCVSSILAPVSLLATSGKVLAFDGSAWGSGNSGQYVFFANVSVATTSTQIMAGASPTATVPLGSGAIIYAAIDPQGI